MYTMRQNTTVAGWPVFKTIAHSLSPTKFGFRIRITMENVRLGREFTEFVISPTHNCHIIPNVAA
jgi:hypothetical protein